MTARQLRIVVLLIAACASFQTAQGFETKAAGAGATAPPKRPTSTPGTATTITRLGPPRGLWCRRPRRCRQTTLGRRRNAVTPIYHQFSARLPRRRRIKRRTVPRNAALASDTDQFGVYYVRGPW